MESQRVKFLISGYLRGWLTFDYTQTTSHLREELIIHTLYEQEAYNLLKNKLFVETTLRSNVQSRSKGLFEPIFDIQKSLIELKLPSALPKDTIKKDAKELSNDDLNAWKEFLEQVNKK